MRISAASSGQSDGQHPAQRRPRDRDGGFTLIEVVLALAVIALIAALALPRTSAGARAAEVRSSMLEMANLLRADRNAALRSGRVVASVFDRSSLTLRAGASPRTVALPATAGLRLVPDNLGGFSFSPNGTASGGIIVLGEGETAFKLDVNAVTGAVEISEL